MYIIFSNKQFFIIKRYNEHIYVYSIRLKTINNNITENLNRCLVALHYYRLHYRLQMIQVAI